MTAQVGKWFQPRMLPQPPNTSWKCPSEADPISGKRSGSPFGAALEAEWEKAARGTDGCFYPWGNEWNAAKCNTVEGGGSGTTPVGKYSPAGDSQYGVADMAGNVWEWCADWFAEDYYQSSSAKNPTGPGSGNRRVLRGGSFGYDRDYARCAVRRRLIPDLRYWNVGFRVVASPLAFSGR